MKPFLALLMFLYFVSAALLSSAHDARPIFIELKETKSDVFVRIKAPDSLQPGALPRLVLPSHCTSSENGLGRLGYGAYQSELRYFCAESLYGNYLELEFPGANPSLSTVIRIDMLEGEQFSAVLPPGTTKWVVPFEETFLGVALQYTRLGVEHIWLGIDHLLFVLCLLFIAKTPRRIFITITGFTVAHSLTLVLSTLEWVVLPIAAVEAVIALSIIFLALEILRNNQASWTYRYPITVASSFGLLHGFGFASVLREIGLPQTELPAALLAFNVGVEIGQILFILAVWLFVHLFSLTRIETSASARVTASYLVGAVASFWLIDRTLGFWV